MAIFPFSSPYKRAVSGFFCPSGRMDISSVQYSSGIKLFISSSLSHIILRATDCTLPALNPRFTFCHSSGLMVYPTIRSRILLVCWESTKFISIVLGSFNDAFTACLVISLKVMRRIFFSSSFKAVARCHDIASPSRSGSVARYTLSAFFASFRSSASLSPFPRIVIYLGS